MTKKTKRTARGFVAKKPPTPAETKAVPPQTSSWQLFIVNLRLLKRFGAPLGLFIIIPGLLSQLGSLFSGDVAYATADPSVLPGFAFSFAAGLLSLLGFGATYYYVLRVLGGNPSGIIESYRKGVPYTWRLILVSAAMAITVVAGLVLCIVPGLIWLRRYFLSIYFVVDEGLDVREAMIASSAASLPVKRHVWTMLVIIATIVAISLAGARYIPVYGITLTIILSASYVFLPALRYQEMTSAVRAGALALRGAGKGSDVNV